MSMGDMYDPVQDWIDSVTDNDFYYWDEQEQRVAELEYQASRMQMEEFESIYDYYNEDDIIDEDYNYNSSTYSSNNNCYIQRTRSYYIKAVGVTYGNRQQNIKLLKTGDELEFVHEPNNQYDSNALLIKTKDGLEIGYVNKNQNKSILDKLNKNKIKSVKVSSVTGENYANKGVNILVTEYCDEVKTVGRIENNSTTIYDKVFELINFEEHPIVVIGLIAAVIAIYFLFNT